jgi:hypothetical protein
MEIGWVKEAPVPVLEIVSGADETTDVSVVGKFPAKAVPFELTTGADVGDETTAASSVAKREAALAAGDGELAAATGDASGFGDDEGALPLASLIAAWSFTCCFNSFTVSVSA